MCGRSGLAVRVEWMTRGLYNRLFCVLACKQACRVENPTPSDSEEGEAGVV